MSDRSATVDQQRGADLAVLVVLATLALFYCYDAVTASTHIYNLIMVVPLTVIVVVLCVVQFISRLRGSSPPPPAEKVTDVLPAMILFSAYVLSLNWLGFDVGTALFVAGFLWMQGERRPGWLLGYSLSFALVLTTFFAKMLPYPMPTLLPVIGGTTF
jgi:hypothetical protein